MGFYPEIFQELEAKLHDSIPSNLMHFKVAGDYESNWLRLRYEEFKNSMYELHFAQSSKKHANYFGTGYLDIVAFYYRKPASVNNRKAWLDAITPMSEYISEQLDMQFVLGTWSNNSVWLAACLQKEPVERDIEIYTKKVTKFIEVTYPHIRKAFQAIGIIR